MAFKFESIPVAEVKAQYAVSKDTMLSRVCREIVAAVNELPEGEATPLMSLEQLEMMNDDFQNWQIRQRDRRQNPQQDGDDKAQIITVDAIARKINADSDTTNVKTLRRNGGLIFGHASDFKADDKADDDGDGDDA